MPAPPDFAAMPLEELRGWPALRICRAYSRVKDARAVKDEAAKCLTVWVTWEPGTTMFQLNIPRTLLERALARWVWDGWTVEVKSDRLW